MHSGAQPTDAGPAIARYGLIGGMAAFLGMVAAPAPADWPDDAWTVAALAVLMAVWWATEALPLGATALAPIVFAPLLGVAPIEQVAGAYAHPLIFLFLGGFLVGKALERWRLDRAVASLALRFGAGGGRGLIGSMMVATAFLSMWISNTAAAMVMAPVALFVARSRARETGPGRRSDDLAAAVMLGVAFSATIGGMSTLIGTPPNALLVGYLEAQHGVTIGFAQWMLFGAPMALALLALTWFVLAHVAFRLGKFDAPSRRDAAVEQGLAEPLKPGARLVAAIAAVAVLALVLRPALASIAPSLPLSDAGVLMTAALVLFAVPSGEGRGERLLRWEDARTIRWDVLILFGGGLALASAIDSSGLSRAIGAVFAALDHLSVAAIVLLGMSVMVLLGELASNTAMAAIFLPVAGAAAGALGAAPLDLVLPIGLAASLGFMLPVATPPNAIVYGAGAVSSGQMLRAGAILDVLSVPVVYAVAVTIGAWVVGS